MLISVDGFFFTFKQRSLLLVHGKIGVKILASLQLKFSQLNEHEFCHNVKGCVRPICSYGTHFKSTKYFCMRRQFFAIDEKISM